MATIAPSYQNGDPDALVRAGSTYLSAARIAIVVEKVGRVLTEIGTALKKIGTVPKEVTALLRELEQGSRVMEKEARSERSLSKKWGRRADAVHGRGTDAAPRARDGVLEGGERWRAAEQGQDRAAARVGRFAGIVFSAAEVAPLLAAGERAPCFQICDTEVGQRRIFGVLTRMPMIDGEKYVIGVSAMGTPWSWAGRLSELIHDETTCLPITGRRLAFIGSGFEEPECRVLAEVPLEDIARARRRWKSPMFGSVEIWFTDEPMIAVGLGILFTREARRVVRLLNG